MKRVLQTFLRISRIFFTVRPRHTPPKRPASPLQRTFQGQSAPRRRIPASQSRSAQSKLRPLPPRPRARTAATRPAALTRPKRNAAASARNSVAHAPCAAAPERFRNTSDEACPHAEQQALREQHELRPVDVRYHPPNSRNTPPRAGTVSSYSSSEISPRTTVSPASSCNFST